MDADTEQAVQLLATSAQGTVLYQHHLCCGNCALCMKWYLRAHHDVIFEYTQKGKLQLKRICWLADLLLSSRDRFPKEQLSSLFTQPKMTSCNTYQRFPCLGLYRRFNEKNTLYNIHTSFLVTQKKLQPSHLKNTSYTEKHPIALHKRCSSSKQRNINFPRAPSPTPPCAAGRATNPDYQISMCISLL